MLPCCDLWWNYYLELLLELLLGIIAWNYNWDYGFELLLELLIGIIIGIIVGIIAGQTVTCCGLSTQTICSQILSLDRVWDFTLIGKKWRNVLIFLTKKNNSFLGFLQQICSVFRVLWIILAPTWPSHLPRTLHMYRRFHPHSESDLFLLASSCFLPSFQQLVTACRSRNDIRRSYCCNLCARVNRGNRRQGPIISNIMDLSHTHDI